MNPDLKIALWVHHHLTPSALRGTARRAPCQFRPEPRIAPALRAELFDYRRSGFDRGHLAPAADFKHNQAEMCQTFYLSNIAPMVGAGFNRTVWAQLEHRLRAVARSQGSLHIITGPILDAGPGARAIGPNRIPVPQAFYKVLLIRAHSETPAALAVAIPNRKFPSSPGAAFTLTPFLLSIDALELRCHLNFFPDLDAQDPDLEAALERSTPALWQALE